MSLQNKISQFDTDSDIVHEWVHGDGIILIGADEVRTIKKLMADKELDIQVIADSIDSWANGPSYGVGSEKEFGGVLIPSPAKLIADHDQAINVASNSLLVQATTQAIAATAQANLATTNGLTQVNKAKDWATKLGSAVEGSEFSSKHWATVAATAYTVSFGLFKKADHRSVAFTKTSNNTLSIKAGTIINLDSTNLIISTDTSIVMPTLLIGVDYAIYACTDGVIIADSNFNFPVGYTTINSRQIGGFHYSPGGHSGLSGGGNSTPQINQYSLWDIKFRPSCTNPKGMVLVADSFWSDIYLCGTDIETNGTSKYNVVISTNTSAPRVPAKFGGNGSTRYTNLDWWSCTEIGTANGKRLPTYPEFCALAYGTTENSASAAQSINTLWDAAYSSKWGCNQVSGVLYQYGAELSRDNSSGWTSVTHSRGQTYDVPDIVIYGGSASYGSKCGSRCSSWNDPILLSDNITAVRFVSFHECY